MATINWTAIRGNNIHWMEQARRIGDELPKLRLSEREIFTVAEAVINVLIRLPEPKTWEDATRQLFVVLEEWEKVDRKDIYTIQEWSAALETAFITVHIDC